MISKRKDPDVLDTSKPILEPPVYPNFPENTPEGKLPKDNPDLLRKSEDDDVENLTNQFDDVELENLNEDDTDLDR
ncbi:hypothetical protein SAMN04487995_1674 [Dyadobacter koreensis]|uniref:Uncharacterized protein n=1 Tax=Dyadobacter koreensis TaxID=408657 RepID=A0A1H6S157_9BACT|nr:hypothetical protein [Dyadobacter koreensis]SEI61671.1 hypothetical protein SAMN04487995_1674 [Dyadobacter koreensis]